MRSDPAGLEAPKVAEIARDFQPAGASLLHDLARFLTQLYGVAVAASDWPADALPAHLRSRLEVVGGNQKTVAVGRDLNTLREELQKVKVAPAQEPQAWQRAAQQWERFGITTWSFEDLPERVTVGEGPEVPVYAWPGLEFAEGNVNVRLFRSPEMAREASMPGVRRLVELAIQKDLGWLEKDLRALSRFADLYAPLGAVEVLQVTALECLKSFVLPDELAFTQTRFQAAVEAARKKLPGLAQQLMDRVGPILQLRQQVQQRVGTFTLAPSAPPRAQTLTGFGQLGAVVVAPKRAANPLAEQLASLIPPRFLATIPFERLPDLPRYLKALLLRAERAALNPVKDQERMRQLAPYLEALKRLESTPAHTNEGRRAVAGFRWMVEEFKVSLFAQELGTSVPVSPVRLDEQLARLRAL